MGKFNDTEFADHLLKFNEFLVENNSEARKVIFEYAEKARSIIDEIESKPGYKWNPFNNSFDSAITKTEENQQFEGLEKELKKQYRKLCTHEKKLTKPQRRIMKEQMKNTARAVDVLINLGGMLPLGSEPLSVLLGD